MHAQRTQRCQPPPRGRLLGPPSSHASSSPDALALLTAARCAVSASAPSVAAHASPSRLSAVSS
eukprot:1445559-Pleurochrysis_carterae.AAC.1